MVAERRARLLQFGIRATHPLHAKQRPASFWRNLLQIPRHYGFREIGKLADCLARGDDTEARIVPSEFLDKALEGRILDSLIGVLKRLHPIQDQERLVLAG